MLFYVNPFNNVFSIGVDSLGMFWTRGTFVGLYFGLLKCVLCGVIVGVPFFSYLLFLQGRFTIVCVLTLHCDEVSSFF